MMHEGDQNWSAVGVLPYDLQCLLDGCNVIRGGSSLKVGRAGPDSDGHARAMLLTCQLADHHTHRRGTEVQPG